MQRVVVTPYRHFWPKFLVPCHCLIAQKREVLGRRWFLANLLSLRAKLIPCQPIRCSSWTKGHWEKFFFTNTYYSSILPGSSHQCSLLIHSSLTDAAWLSTIESWVKLSTHLFFSWRYNPLWVYILQPSSGL